MSCVWWSFDVEDVQWGLLITLGFQGLSRCFYKEPVNRKAFWRIPELDPGAVCVVWWTLWTSVSGNVTFKSCVILLHDQLCQLVLLSFYFTWFDFTAKRHSASPYIMYLLSLSDTQNVVLFILLFFFIIYFILMKRHSASPYIIICCRCQTDNFFFYPCVTTNTSEHIYKMVLLDNKD